MFYSFILLHSIRPVNSAVFSGAGPPPPRSKCPLALKYNAHCSGIVGLCLCINISGYGNTLPLAREFEYNVGFASVSSIGVTEACRTDGPRRLWPVSVVLASGDTFRNQTVNTAERLEFVNMKFL